MTNVKFTALEGTLLRTMAVAGISEDRIEASEMHMDGTVTFWVAIDPTEEALMDAQGIKAERY